MIIQHVAVGIIQNTYREILISQRAPNTYWANKWEFPGGKIKIKETKTQALVRELQEEVGISVTHYSSYKDCIYQRSNHFFKLHFFLVDQWQGRPWGKEGQHCFWLPRYKLKVSKFPPANASVINKLIHQ